MVATSDQFLVPTPTPVPHLTPTRLEVQLVELILKRNGKKYTRVHLKASSYIWILTELIHDPSAKEK